MSRRCPRTRASAGPVVLTALLLAGAAGCTDAPATQPAGWSVPASGPAALPDPAPPAPALPDPAPMPPATAAAARTPGAVTLACAAVQEALTDAVVRYEVQALAEDGPGGGDRTAAAVDMGAAVERAVRAAGAVPGLAAAAAPAVAELVALRDGMAVRADLDEDDAGPWRAARDRLESWCEAQA